MSKLCCPVCYHLLKLLKGTKDPFIVRGAHGTVSACTLPPWIPEQVVDLMNMHFGDLLRKELGKLMAQTVHRNRTRSTGSERLSLDSTRSESVQDMPNPDYYGEELEIDSDEKVSY